MVELAINLISAIAAGDYYRAITTEELNTYFKEVEGILNWGILTTVSSISNDFDYLSPMSLLNSAILPSVLPGQILESESIRKSLENGTCYGPRLLAQLTEDLFAYTCSQKKVE